MDCFRLIFFFIFSRDIKVPRPAMGDYYFLLVALKDFHELLVTAIMDLPPGLGTSIDLESADKELKAVTPEKSKTCVTAFTKKLVTTFQLSRTRSCHFFLK